MKPKWYTQIDGWVCAFALLIVLALVILPGCQSYQPPGENLWLTVR